MINIDELLAWCRDRNFYLMRKTDWDAEPADCVPQYYTTNDMRVWGARADYREDTVDLFVDPEAHTMEDVEFAVAELLLRKRDSDAIYLYVRADGE